MSEVALMRLKEIFNKSKSAKPKLIKYIDFIDNSSVINITKINHIKILADLICCMFMKSLRNGYYLLLIHVNTYY